MVIDLLLKNILSLHKKLWGNNLEYKTLRMP